MPNPAPVQYSFLNNEQTDILVPLKQPNNTVPLAFGTKTAKNFKPKISIKPSSLKRQICENLNCTFNINETCVHHLDSTQWHQSSIAIGDLM